MKNIYKYAMIASAVLSLAACNDLIESSEPAVDIERAIILTATREGTNPNTRSVRMDDGTTWWGPKEEISVFYGSGSNGGSKFTSNNTTLAETTEFEGSISMSGNKEFWAVYPYSTENTCDGNSIITIIPDYQIGSEGNFSGDSFPAVGKSSSLTMPFWNICGGIKFFVSRTDIQSVTIKGNNGEALAGKVKVAFNAGGKPELTEVLDGQTEVTLVAPDDGCFKPGKYYYITLLPKALDGGFTMTFSTEKEKGELVSDKAQTIKRSTFGVLKNVDSKVSNWESTVVGPDWVDLGLSVKWATFNVGATKPEEYGDYFAWGETESKEYYSWETYKFRTSGDSYDNVKFSKYNTDSSRGVVDNNTVLDLEDDVAHVKWGGNWRMPTFAELQELLDNCTWEWTNNYNGTGVSGRKVTSNKAGYTDKSIFLPAADLQSGTYLAFAGSYGFYWSSSLGTDLPYTTYYVHFYSNGVSRGTYGRYLGLSVRPVYGEFVPVASITLNESSLNLIVNSSAQLVATISPSNATEPSVRWVSADKSIVTVDENGNVTAVAVGTTTVSAYASNGLSSSCEVTVTQAAAEPEAVDLGLSVKWATFNVGATKPEDYGDYFAWGETEPKSNYSWSTYKFRTSGDSDDNVKFNKYCTQSSYWDSTASMDNKTVLDPEDDAAHVNWGGSWRMPTDAEWTELRTKCTWTWTSQNGVNGRLGTGPNGNSIFLPVAGNQYDTRLNNAGSYGFYWSSSLNTGNPIHAWHVRFNSGGVSRSSYGYRYSGQSVRPVYGEFVPVTSITLNESSLSLKMGSSAQLVATISPSNATEPSVRWVSADKSIVTVDENGNVTAVAEGTTTVSAYASNGLSASCLFSISSGQIFSIESWELNPDLIVGAMDRLNKNRPASEAYYGNEPYKTYGGIGLYNPASEDDRTSLFAHFRDYSACWKNANVESNYTFKVINYKNTIVDIVGSGTNTSFGADANGCAFVTMPGADLIGIAEQTLVCPDILFREPNGLQAGKDVLIEVSERINGQEMKGYYFLVPNAVSRNQIEFTGQGAELGAFHDSNDYILVHELMPIIYKNGKEIIKWNSSSQSWTITSEGQSLGLKDAGLISVRINFLIFDKNEKDSDDSFKGRLSIFEPGDYITPYPYPVGSVSEAGINWWDGDLAALMSDKIAGYKMAVYYYGLDNPLVTTIEGEVKVLASGKKEHPYHHPDGSWWN